MVPHSRSYSRVFSFAASAEALSAKRELSTCIHDHEEPAPIGRSPCRARWPDLLVALPVLRNQLRTFLQI